MNDIASLVGRITEDLRTLQNAMVAAGNEPLPDGAHEGSRSEIINTALFAEFKGVIDEMRQVLWCYMELIAARRPTEIAQSRIEKNRLRLIADMLRILSPRTAPRAATLPGTASFFERIDFVVSSRLAANEQRHKITRDAA